MGGGYYSAVWLVITAGFLSSVGAAAGEHASARLSGSVMTYTVVRGDTLAGIAARFGVYPATIASDNGIDSHQPLQGGRQLRIDNTHIVPETVTPGQIVVNVPQRMAFFEAAGQVMTYPIAVGRPTWQTPTGSFTVAIKDKDPAWHPPESIRAESARTGHLLPLVVPPGPSNPLGRYWIGLTLSGIGLHGTPLQSSIYQATSHGCVRLQKDAIEDLFGRVSVGTPGQVIYEPVLLAVVGDEVFLEVHPDIYGKLRLTAHEEARRLTAGAGVDGRVDWVLTDREIDRHAGVAWRVAMTR